MCIRDSIIVAHTTARKISEIYMLPISVFGAASATFSSQNYGAGRIDRVKAVSYTHLPCKPSDAGLVPAFYLSLRSVLPFPLCLCTTLVSFANSSLLIPHFYLFSPQHQHPDLSLIPIWCRFNEKKAHERPILNKGDIGAKICTVFPIP